MNKILLVLIFTAGLFLMSCGGEEPIDESTASLLLKVTHVDGSSVIDAKVDLYESQIDYQDATNSVATMQTDNTGDVLFTDLALKQYWFAVTYQDLSNSSSAFSTGRKLLKDERLEKITQLR